MQTHIADPHLHLLHHSLNGIQDQDQSHGENQGPQALVLHLQGVKGNQGWSRIQVGHLKKKGIDW